VSVLPRTFSPSRWGEYRRLLEAARESGYETVSLEEWVIDRARDEPGAVFLLRHDVDHHPGSAVRMAAIEAELGVHSTWYFRWRTARSDAIHEVRRRGGHVGLHYETLTRVARARGIDSPAEAESLVDECRVMLREEIELFTNRFGAIRSVCPHGDSRLPQISNGVLLQGEDLASYGIRFDAKRGLLGRPVKFLVTDRSAAKGGWQNGKNPHRAIDEKADPILCVTHPNNWAAGPGLWADRLLRRVRGWSDEPFA
jgi:hypothetical protein